MRTVVIVAVAAILGEALSTQTAQARDYYDDDDIWDLMNPAWWADEMFDDDDDWRYYRRPHYNPYWGGPPYRRQPQVIVIQPEPELTAQDPETRLPE